MQWLRWLSPGMRIKRWVFLFAIGVVFFAVGLLLLLNYSFNGQDGINYLYILKHMLESTFVSFPLFISGGILIISAVVIGYSFRKVVSAVKYSLFYGEDRSILEKIFKESKLAKGPAITVIGGGTGLSMLLSGIKHITGNCSAVVTTADDGGSSGRLRKELNIIPPGDLRNCLVSLAETELLMGKMMQYRFDERTNLKGHSLGNLLIAAMADAEGSMEAGLNSISKILQVRGQVIPATLDKVNLEAEMEDGMRVYGESNIPKAAGKIKSIKMVPMHVNATKTAVEAIKNAEVLILGPGSLYTSILPNLLIEDIKKAIIESKAVKVYVCNVMTQPGETDGYTAIDHLEKIINEVGEQFIDYVIVNKQKASEEQVIKYKKKGAEQVFADVEGIERMGIKVIAADLLNDSNLVRHNSIVLAQTVIQLIYDLKLIGKGVRFFDYFYVRQTIKTLKQKNINGEY